MSALHHGDCLAIMPTLEPESIDAVITDPPYGLDFLDHSWDHGVPGRPFWAEMLRLAKPGAHLLSFGGTRTVHRIATAIEDAGWEIRDTLVWGYATGMPKDGNVAYEIDRMVCPLPNGHRVPGARLRDGEHVCARSEQGWVWDDWSTTLKPAWEPIVLARKAPRGTVAASLMAHGTGALNIGATRAPVAADDPVNEREWVVRASATRPGTVGFLTSHEDGMRIPTAPKGGRWPANIALTSPIFDGGVEGVVGGGEARSTGDYPAPEGWTAPGYGGTFAQGPIYDDAGSYSRFFLVAKASRSDREPILGANTARENTHPTVKPLDLMRHLVRLVTPPGGTVLDPFGGSGTTALAAEREGFGWVLIEREEAYVKMAKARLVGTQRGLGL